MPFRKQHPPSPPHVSFLFYFPPQHLSPSNLLHELLILCHLSSVFPNHELHQRGAPDPLLTAIPQEPHAEPGPWYIY